MTLPAPDPNEGFLTDIDEAMKAKVSGIQVGDRESGGANRLVRTYFRWPQAEVTDQTFPFITIDLLDYLRAADREQRAENFPLAYAPKNYTLPADPDDDSATSWLIAGELPIPFDFIYQITLHTRYNSHVREVQYKLLDNERLAPRGAYLIVGDTVRAMRVDGPVDASGLDPQEGGRPKRHFRKVWTATVETELFQSTIDQMNAATSLTLAVTTTTE